MLDVEAGAPTDGVIPGRAELAALAAHAGIRSVHLLARRDLDDAESGGSEVHMARVAERWAEAGLRVTVRTAEARGTTATDWRDGYRVIRRANRLAVFPTTVLDELLGREGRPDAVVEAWNGVPYLTPLWFRGPKAVILHHVHEEMWDLVLAQPTLARAGRFLELRLAPPAYQRVPIIALCPSAREQIVQRLDLPRANIVVAAPGVDERFSVDEGTPRDAEPLVVAVGRLMPPKRFDVHFEAAVRLRADHPTLRLVIVGEGVERERLEAVVAAHDAGGWISLPGRLGDDEVVDLYRRAWVVAATSVAEGWGLTLTEAAACGTPAVATRISGHADAVEDGVSGLLAGDEAELVTHLDAVLRDDELRTALGRGAQKRAAALTWDATAWGVFAPLADQALARRADARR